MVKHRVIGEEWWCLPGGGVDAQETTAEAALRELKEECSVVGKTLCQTATNTDGFGIDTVTFWIEISNQEPHLGTDPEFSLKDQILVGIRWLTLAEIPERDRAYLWAAGLMCVPGFVEEISGWGDALSYPSQ
jgi:8-oxo-dGTP diphosphatase